jgi:hypothetical protein
MMAASLTEPVGADEQDPLDLPLHRPPEVTARPAKTVPWHVRLGLSWSSGSPPAILLLLLGAAMGPRALAVLTPRVLSWIDPAVPVALAVLGVHVGLNVDLRRQALTGRLALGAGIEALVTGVIVTTGTLFLLSPEIAAATFHSWLIALAAGMCASMSSALPTADAARDSDTPAMRLRNLDVLLPTILGGALLAWVREGSPQDAAILLGQATLLALVIAAAAWLLLARTTSDTEQRIFGVATLLLVGGLADYLSLSSLLSGLVAGSFWRLTGGRASESIRRDVIYFQHPLLVLMLVSAGARMTVTPVGALVVLAYPLLRTVGKLAGGWVARGVAPRALPPHLGMALLSPGIFGIAFAMNATRSAGPQADPLLSIVALGTIVSQLLWALRRARDLRA